MNNPLPHWDTHFDNNRRLRDELLPPFDQCFSAFLEDLAQRGLLDSTLVVCMGEFGRTPRFGQFTGNGVDGTGRDHWSQCYSLVTAGGSRPGGEVVGRSDRFAAYPADNPITPQDLAASLLDALGVDPGLEVRDAFGRPAPLSGGRVTPALFVRDRAEGEGLPAAPAPTRGRASAALVAVLRRIVRDRGPPPCAAIGRGDGRGLRPDAGGRAGLHGAVLRRACQAGR